MTQKGVKKSFLYALAILVLFNVLSCSTTDSGQKNKFSENLNSNDKDLYKENKKEKNQIASNVVKTLPVSKKESISGNLLKTIQQKKKEEEDITEKEPFYNYFLEKDKSIQKDIPVTISFDAAPITEIIPVFSKILNFNYYVDPSITGIVTMFIDSSMKKNELWKVFKQILWLTGSYCVVENNILQIRPFNKLPSEKNLFSTTDVHSNISVALLPVKNVKSSDVVNNIKPFMSDNAIIINIETQNSILVIELPGNMNKIKNLIAKLDTNTEYNWPRSVIKCCNIPASKAREELTNILPLLGFPVSANNTSDEPGAIKLQALDRLQLLIATAANEQALKEIKKWVNVLDRNDVGEQEQVYIYKIINAKADELVKALSVIFNLEGKALEIQSVSSDGITSKLSTLKGPEKEIRSSKKTSQPAAPLSVFEVPVKVFSDTINNRLIFRTTPRTFAMIKALLNTIDTIPSQVLLQIIIAEISLTSETDFGIEFQQNIGPAGFDEIVGTSFTSLTPTKGTNEGFAYKISGGNTELYVRALAKKGNTKLLARPQILVESHTEASVQVGEDIPLLTQDITNTQSVSKDDTVVQRNFEYRNTGIILKITPHVTKGGLITAELDQTVSSPVVNTTSTIDSPSIRTREMKTTLSFPDKSTVIIGGLIQNKYQSTQSTIPIIGNIPYLSDIIGANNIQKERTELLLLIKGTIINRHTKLEEIVEEYRRATDYIGEMQSKDNISNNVILNDSQVNKILVD